MEEQIFLQYAPAMNVADEIKTISSEVESLLEGDINNEVNKMLGEWEGSAAESFMEQYNALKARFNEFYSSISNISATIQSASDQINGTDTKLSA